MIRHLVVIGAGLIGGSFALAMRRLGLVGRVTGVGRGRANLEEALRLGVIDAIDASATGRQDSARTRKQNSMRRSGGPSR